MATHGDAEFAPGNKPKKTTSAKTDRSNADYARERNAGKRGDKQSKPHNPKRGKS